MKKYKELVEKTNKIIFEFGEGNIAKANNKLINGLAEAPEEEKEEIKEKINLLKMIMEKGEQ